MRRAGRTRGTRVAMLGGGGHLRSVQPRPGVVAPRARRYDRPVPASIVTGPVAHERLERARDWLLDRDAGEEVLIVAASPDAAHELLRSAAQEAGAAFGWHRKTLDRLAADLAAPSLVADGLVPVGRLVSEAVTARVVHRLSGEQALGRFTGVAGLPGFARAVAGVLGELRLASLEAGTLEESAPELRVLFEAYVAELVAAALADRPEVLARARAAAASEHVWLARPLLLLDLTLETAGEAGLVEALVSRGGDVLATVPAGDAQTLSALEGMGLARETLARERTGSLPTLQEHLFEAATPAEVALDAEVALFNAPGESRESVEIARRLLRHARGGVPFDRMAVLLRSPEEYRPHLVEALARAGIPAHFARGAVQPDPAGRAFLALLACAAEGLSARRFAEYLSLGQTPDVAAETEATPSEAWVAPDEELVPEVVAAALEVEAPDPESAPLADSPDDAPATGGTLRAPRRWEQLLVDAAVIGGRERWARRLDGLAREIELDLAELADPDSPARERMERRRSDLANLRDYALPRLDALAALPAHAPWGDWLDALTALASSSLREPQRVLSVLAELAPMAAVGPVELEEVRLVLSRRLLELAVPAARVRYGRVFVAPAEAARGLSFDVVCVPGLAERLFPKKVAEEPILLDRLRRELGAGLVTNEQRVARERLALRLAVGAARSHLILSYPRLDLDQARPRVPSFYALEALRAAEGRLPGFEELKKRAETAAAARVGWPAPEQAEDAIDEAEYDLSLLQRLLEQGEAEGVGTARFLLDANPYLGRALRFRARRWLRSWTQADGFLASPTGELAAGAREAAASQRLAARSYSPTALQHFASCPYRFFLQAVQRLAPREVPEAIDELDPLQRGSLVHEVQFELLGRLRDEKLLPVRAQGLARARDVLDDVLDGVAERHREELAPAIDRVWQDGVASLRADLREWLRRTSEDDSGFVPWRFELAFGLPGRRDRDPNSVDDPVPLDCGIQLRGSIDLVERAADGRLRVTDHKTGKRRVESGEVVSGGEALQPVLYALATEKLFPDAAVDCGRLYYCTSAGGFDETVVPLDDTARESAAAVADIVDRALAEPFLPAAPAEGACRWCDYQEVCGPYEELRSARKPAGNKGIEALAKLRSMR